MAVPHEVLADYIFQRSLPLADKLIEIFSKDLLPKFEVEWNRMLEGHDWEAYEKEIRSQRRQELEALKRAVMVQVSQELRTVDLVAVGSTNTTLEVVRPGRWRTLQIKWGNNAVRDDAGKFDIVHVATTARLGTRQRQDLNDLLYKDSQLRISTGRGSPPSKGRPENQTLWVTAWIEGHEKHGQLPPVLNNAKAKALEHFRPFIAVGAISERTVLRVLGKFYEQQPPNAKRQK